MLEKWLAPNSIGILLLRIGDREMIICVKLESIIKDQLDRLVAIGGYRDYSEAVGVAISNQLLLHASDNEAQAPAVIRRGLTKAAGQSSNAKNTANAVPSLFSAVHEDSTGVKIAQSNVASTVAAKTISPDQWIWGQHNKLLPVKAVCRALAHLLTRDLNSYEGIPLARASSEIAAEAVKLGDYLREWDHELGLHRDDALAFAFPRRGADNEDKSRLRFATQFVASVGSDAVLSGLPADLKLIGVDGSRGARILLTEEGWTFARMENPILDAMPTRPVRKFSDEESCFLLSHVMQAIPYEASALKTVVELIDSGANTPESLDRALADYLPTRDGRPFTAAFLTTQRAGVISRLNDLGMIQRVREGIKVAYALTERGLKYFPQLTDRTA